MKRVIEKVVIKRLNSTDIEGEIMQHLSSLQAEHPELEWDFNIYGIQFVPHAAFRGYRQVD